MTTGPRHLVLVGLSGVGKSTIGAALAAATDRPLVDTDDVVARMRAEPPEAIIRSSGIEEFREAEAAALRAALDGTPPAVIATGGGIVEMADNRRLLGDQQVVWLDASVEEIVMRIAADDQDRPLLDGDPVDTLAALDARRRAWYAEVADVTVRTDGRSVDEVVAEVCRAADGLLREVS